MKATPLLLLLAIAGCDLDVNLNDITCTLTGGRLMCNAPDAGFADAGNGPTDGGLPSDSGKPDASIGDGQAPKLDGSADPIADAGQTVDSGALLYTFCSNEFQDCAGVGPGVIRFGNAGQYTYTVVDGTVRCSFEVLGDPLPGQAKECWRSSSVPDAGKPPVVDAGQPTPVDASVPPTGQWKVVGAKLFDPNGNEFRLRGDNVTHVDAPSVNFNSNAERSINYFQDDPDKAIGLMRTGPGWSIAHQKVQIPGSWDGTCKSDMATFNGMVNRWVRDIPKYNAFSRYMLLNIANEFGNSETEWRDAYVAAIPKIRNAGWTGVIVVDAPGCGQNGMAVARNGAAVLAADPLRSLLFDVHVYGAYTDASLVSTLDALKATGLAVVLGEIGPGRNIGPSPTLITPERVVALAEARGFGWLLWSSNDWSQAGCASNDSDFAFLKRGCDPYTGTDAELTQFGRSAKALYLQYGATKASIF